MRCSNMAAEFKNGEKTGRYPSRYTDSFTAKNTCTDNYGALYCKVPTLRLDFAWEGAIARLWVLRGPFQHHSSDVVSVSVASCGGRMPECTSTRERFAFFSKSALYDGCVVFFVHVLLCLRLREA